MLKTCSKCEAEFTCTNETAGCWCEEVSLSNTTLKQLKEEFDNCLCPSCLKEYECLHKDFVTDH
jgi:hypothetical protein